MRKNGRITAYIDLGAIEENFQQMKAKLKEGTQMIAVIKADGYGHGAVEVARLSEPYEYIWGFAVAAFGEAKLLRDAGIQKPILILGYSFEEDYEEMVQLGIRPAVFTMEMAEKIAQAAGKAGVCAPVHLAVDTGMSRIGVPDTNEGADLAKAIHDLPDLFIEGVFTHFSKADETDKAYTWMQMDGFVKFCDQIEAMGVIGIIRHCSNSAGILEIPEANMDLVRAGISIYGIYPSDEVSRESIKLRPAMELKSHIVYLKTVEAGTAISYGGTYVTTDKRRIATIPVGYADGYPRSLSNMASVLIRGNRAPVVGRVCMDQLMVDVTGIEAEILDEVTLLGRDGEEEITVEELGALSERFPYEFVCDIGKRVPRKYIK